MRKQMIGIGLFSLALLLAGGVERQVYAQPGDVIEEDSISLIQDGDIIIPEEDYSFEIDSIRSYTDAGSSSLAADQLAAQEARANDNETLDDRKKECAKKLYNAMVNLDSSVIVSEFALNGDEFNDTISDVINSNPELFYIGQEFGKKTFYLSGTSGEKIVKECLGFYECQEPIFNSAGNVTGYTEVDKDLINAQRKELEDKKNLIISQTLSDKMSDAEKALLLHDYIIMNLQYDYGEYLENEKNGTSKYPESDYDIYGALVKKQAVCQGYTLAYKYLMKAAGIDKVGFACNDKHIWNTVTINNEGYYVDCTWDDPSWDTLGNAKHIYFLKGQKDFPGHGIIEKSDTVCDGSGFRNYFWNDVNSGIFYRNGIYYYINAEGKLCERDDIGGEASVKENDISLNKSNGWNFVNAAKLALADNYAVYHDSKTIYAYNYSNGSTEVIYSPEMEESELIYGIGVSDDTLLFGTRNVEDVSNGIINEQKIRSYSLPSDVFTIPVTDVPAKSEAIPETSTNVPITGVSIQGPDTMYIKMVDGSYSYDRSVLKAVISPSDATNQKIRSWSSSNKSVAVIDINGSIKAVAPGETTITVVTMEGPTAVKKIKVIYDGDIKASDGAVLHYDEGVLLADQFYTENGMQYYLGADGKQVTGLQNINDKTYYFDANGVMLTGWQTIDGANYYFDANGVMQRNCFLDINGSRYFLNIDGTMGTGWLSINGKTYYFNTNGVMLTGWQNLIGKTYYFDSNGVMLTGWQAIEGKNYYFNKYGFMLTGWQTINGQTYYFDGNGVCQTVGWQVIDGKMYYFSLQSIPVTGWQIIDSKTYYFSEKGVMLTGWQKIEGKRYYFDNNGVMLTGWKTIKKKKYYFSKNGVMTTGWKTIKKKKYYFSKKGVMTTGWKTIKGKKYYFTKKGVMVKGVKVIKGVSYYFAPDGHFVS